MHQCLGWSSGEERSRYQVIVEICSMIKLGQMDTNEMITQWEQFYSLTA